MRALGRRNDAVSREISQDGRSPASAGTAHVLLPTDLLLGNVGIERSIVAGELVLRLDVGAGREIPACPAELGLYGRVPVLPIDALPVETVSPRALR